VYASVAVVKRHTWLRTRLAEAVCGDFLHHDSCNKTEVKLLQYLA